MGRPPGRSYGDDLAHIHDVGHGDFATESAPGLLALLREHGVRNGRVVDLGCGSGLWARELDRAGYDAVGIDYSRAMLRIARKRVPGARFRQGSFHDVKLPRCRAVTALGEVLCYRFESGMGQRVLENVARRVFAALEPGGLFILDLAGPGRTGRTGAYELHRMGDDWAVLVSGREDAARRSLTRDITTFRKVGRLYRRDRELHRLELYPKSEAAQALRGVGFRVRTLRGYGDRTFVRGHAGFMARKP